MIELFRTSSWALLPASDVIEKIWHLYNYNQSLSTATLSRKKFTEVRLKLKMSAVLITSLGTTGVSGQTLPVRTLAYLHCR